MCSHHLDIIPRVYTNTHIAIIHTLVSAERGRLSRTQSRFCHQHNETKYYYNILYTLYKSIITHHSRSCLVLSPEKKKKNRFTFFLFLLLLDHDHRSCVCVCVCCMTVFFAIQPEGNKVIFWFSVLVVYRYFPPH